MEWVEATGRTVTEAKDAALDLLGVAGDEAEFEVIADVEKGLFGRIKAEARVRARVRPTQPRPKPERDRNRKSGGRGKSGGGNGGGNGRNRGRNDNKSEAKKGNNRSDGGGRDGNRDGNRGGSDNAKSDNKKGDRAMESGGRNSGSDGNGGGERSKPSPRVADGEGVSLAEQGQIVEDFVLGLTDAFGVEATATTVSVDEDTLEVQVEGADLGLLIGPKANTLRCVQELSRTVVQRQGDREQGRVRVDIGSYYAERRASLARFTTQVAEQVKDSGEEVALEPMRAADRKVVHDTVGDIEGVDTVSEGSDPDRRVVIVPA